MKSESWMRHSEHRCRLRHRPVPMSRPQRPAQRDKRFARYRGDSRCHRSALPDGSEFTTRRYNSRLSLNRTMQPYLSAGGGGAGSFLRAGIALSFGDMLGDQRLQTSLQVGKTIDDFAAQAAYLNMRSRWNWAIVGGQVPWLTGGATDSKYSAAGRYDYSRGCSIPPTPSPGLRLRHLSVQQR